MLKLQVGGTGKDGKPFHLILLGLSHGNLRLLKEGKPIDMDGTEIGLPEGTRIFIFSGETEQAMARELAEFIGPETEVHISPKLRD